MTKVQTPTQRDIVDTDTRRNVAIMARSRKPGEVEGLGHEAFIRGALKEAMGWPARDPGPLSIQIAAKEMAVFLVKRDEEIAKRKTEAAAKHAANMAAAEAT